LDDNGPGGIHVDEETLTGTDIREADPSAPALDEPGLRRGSRIGRFTVLRELGSGGMGMVVAAHDPKLDRDVALKLLKPGERGQGRDDMKTRLLREARALAKLNHPNVISIHDVDTHEDEIFIAEELVDGRDLRAWRREKSRAWRDALEVLCQAGRALAAAHAAGIIHRDFKPGNVVVDREERVRVLDFGLAKRLEDDPETSMVGEADTVAVPYSEATAGSETRTGTLLGTPLYMAPEQHQYRAADARSDIFSFCVTLYETLYGEPPFAGTSLQELRANVTGGNVRDAPQGADVPAWLRRVLLRGLRPNPDERYPSMETLLRDLERDPTAGRKRTLVVAGIAVSFALAGAAAVLGVAWRSGAFDGRPAESEATSAQPSPTPAASPATEHPVTAEEQRATELWKKGTAQYQLRHYARAAKLYEEAYEAAPAPFFLFNIAQAYRLAGDCESALHFFKEYLRSAEFSEPRDKSVEQQVEDRISQLTAECGVDAAPR